MIFKRASDMISRMVDITLTGTQQINDFSDGSVILTLYEAIATQIEALYVLSWQNIKDGIEQSIYDAFGFSRRASQKAYGNLTINFNTYFQEDFTLSRGTQFGSSNPAYTQVYETLDAYTIPSGTASAVIPIYCTELGTVGNVPANKIDTVLSYMGNIQSVTNASAFQTGQDEEDLSSVKNRFRSYIASIGRATLTAIDYGIRQIPEVAGVYVDEEVGYIKVYCHDLNGDLSDDLKASVISALVDYRPAGIPLDVFPIVKRLFDLSLTVTLNDKSQGTQSYQDYIEGIVTNYLNTKSVSQDLILSDIVQLVKNIDTQNIYDVSISSINDSVAGIQPIGNVVIASNELIRSGQITITLQ